ncbi:signal recognition particle, SRP9/SRP14 subunit [Scheffersomyces coipomensis]|uniref:signal recognition particle, SRP9/SRP14 subunit n=1 Tax=Scheffersomyces coipomensis TaxID=1788519 RepID=UPI00315D3F08
MRVDNHRFLAEISEVLTSNNGKNSIYLTQKRLKPSLDLEPTTNTDNTTPNEDQYPILIRIAMNGKERKDHKKDKFKLSTVVEVSQLDSFWQEYIQIIKNGFVGLRKKEKKKSKKGKVSK